MDKKAVIAVQFHWIFIIIAGALILLFFANIVIKQKDVSDIQISATVITDFDAILTGALVSTGTVNIVDMPRYDINFECDVYRIGQLRKETKDRVIFSTDLIKGGTLIAYGKDWSHPYRSSNFLYLTTPQVRYIIVDDNTYADWINETMPDEINKDFVNAPYINGGSLQNLNDYRVRFIYFSEGQKTSLEADSLAPFINMPNEAVSAIVIEPSAEAPKMLGKVKFYQKQGLTWYEVPGSEEAYITEEGLLGAIYSADHDMYTCAMQKAFKKLNIVTEIIYNRSIHLADLYGAGTTCNDVHTSAANWLDEVITNSQEFNYNNANQIRQSLGTNSLQSENKRAQLYSCVLVY
ncbi:MAG: hypothetical protein KJ922_06670 [Nanoarchaeota archaeon]|nr:hypothetical protein [Nanoarchaeota archaeon]